MTMGNAGRLPASELPATPDPAREEPVREEVPAAASAGEPPAISLEESGDDAREDQAGGAEPSDRAATGEPLAQGEEPSVQEQAGQPQAGGREDAVRAALERVLVSPDLCTSPRLGAFLRYVVEATLAGRADQIKGYTIAVEALGRPHSFDPQADPIVRVEATRLRRALQNYYNTVGLADPIQIHIPKGGYVPQFQDRTFPDWPAAGAASPLTSVPSPPGLSPSPAALTPGSAAAPAGFTPTMEPAAAAVADDAGDGASAPALPLPPRLAPPRWALMIGAAAIGAVVAAAALRLTGAAEWPEPVEALLGVQAPLADRVRLPIVEVGQFEIGEVARPRSAPGGGDLAAGGEARRGDPQGEAQKDGPRDGGGGGSAVQAAGEATRGPDRAELRGIEERLRDSFALFDFIEVRAGGAQGAVSPAVRACAGRHARSVFSLGGFTEPREDGTYALMVHLTDRCQGTIIWSHVIEGLRAGMGGEGEEKVVRAIAPTLLERYGVVSVRARAQVQAHAPASGFGCIAEAFSVLRDDGTAPTFTPRTCLGELVARDGEFALGHAVRAAAMLDDAMRDAAAALPQAKAEEMLAEAELAADLAPASAYAARTLALVQLYLGETEAAVASGKRALELNPLDHDIAATVGTIFIGAGRVEEGEALLVSARAQGATRTPLQEAYLAMAAFFRSDPFAAKALLPQLRLHPNPGNQVALALALHALDRFGDEREAVRALAHLEGGGPEAVRRLVRHLLPAPAVADRALNALESAGLAQEAAGAKRPRG